MNTFKKLIIIVLILFFGYLILCMVLNSEKTEPFTYEIFAAIIGFAITALTTWSLLGKQTENELNKEVRIRFFNFKNDHLPGTYKAIGRYCA